MEYHIHLFFEPVKMLAETYLIPYLMTAPAQAPQRARQHGSNQRKCQQYLLSRRRRLQLPSGKGKRHTITKILQPFIHSHNGQVL